MRFGGEGGPSWFRGLFAGLAAVYVAMIPLPRVDNHLLGSDGGHYYCYMRSFWLDGDVQIGNDIALYNARISHGSAHRLAASYDRSIGPAVLWSPFFLVAHALTVLLSAVGVPVATDGFSYLEEAAVCIASIFYAVAGLLAVSATVSRHVPGGSALTGVLFMFLSTFAVYYALFEPSMGHSVEFFTVCVFVWSILGRGSRTTGAWILVGLAGGLMTLVRWQNLVFALLVPYGLARVEPPVSRAVIRGGAAGIAWLAVASIQCMFWHDVFGKVLTIPQGPGFLAPAAPQVLDVLFSTRHGLVSWHPAFAVAAAGMLMVRPRGLALVLSLAVLAQVYICSMVIEWWCGDSFGMRRMTGTIPLLTFGAAFLIERAGRLGRAGRRIAACVGVAMVAWNFLFMAQYRLGMIPPGDALSLSEMTTGKLRVFTHGIEHVRQRMEPRASGSGAALAPPGPR